MQEEIIPIENREIRGITAKQMVWLFSMLCAILVSVVGTYFKITAAVQQNAHDLVELSTKEEKDLLRMTVEMDKVKQDCGRIVTDNGNLELKILVLETELKSKGVIPVNE